MSSYILEFTEYISPDGEIYRFETGTKFMMSITGTGMPPINYLNTQSYDQHGQSYYDYRLAPRTIQIVHRVNACSREEYWNNRYGLLNILRPNRQTSSASAPGHLRTYFSDGSARQVDAYIDQGPVFAPRSLDSWDEWGIMETLRFVCPDPTFYDPVPHVQSFLSTGNESSTHWQLPWTFDGVNDLTFVSMFGGATISTSAYAGNWLSYPRIVLSGPMDNVLITNTSTGKILSLVHSISAGQTITIELQYGQRSVVDSLGNNLLYYMSPESDLTTFCIQPDPTVAGGVNNITFFFSGATDGVTGAVVTYYDRYIGI